MTGEARDSISEDAVTWFVLLRDAEVSSAERARFDAWLQADPRHRQAWAEVEGLWSGMDAMAPSVNAPIPFPARRKSPTGWRRFAAAAAVLLLVAAGFWIAAPSGYREGLFADYRTGAGESMTVTLPDGSTAMLGAASAMSVRYGAANRQVRLHHGEAYYAVTRDADRPFVVAAGAGRVAVVGTEFDVKFYEAQTTVAVAKGVVDVSGGTGAPVRLAAGQDVRYGQDTVSAVRGIDAANVGAWRGGRLVFQGATLGEVLRDLERYRPGRIVVTDEAIAGLPVTGAFDTSRPDAALDTIERTLPVKLVRLGDLLVLVRPAD